MEDEYIYRVPSSAGNIVN